MPRVKKEEVIKEKKKATKITPKKATTKDKTEVVKKKIKSGKNNYVVVKKKKFERINNMFIKCKNYVKKHNKFVISLIAIIVLTIALFIIIPIISLNQNVITINNTNYTKSDFNIYLYSVKYNYFGKDNTNVPEATLNTKVNDAEKTTIKEYLKDKTTDEIKTASAIKDIAKENDIKLSKEDKQEIEKEKTDFIKKLGGKKEFKRMLNINNTTEKSYNKMLENDKLYQLIYNKLYSENKINDLTSDEKKEASNIYYSEYKKIRQIVLATIDLTTGKSLNETQINQKETLMNSILKEAKSGVDFDELIKKYSEDISGNDGPYYVYYKDGQLIEEIEKVANNLNIGDISGIVKSNNGFHIIKKDELDDSRLNIVYNQKREEKLIKSISEKIEKLSIIYQNPYDNLKIK